MPKVSVIIPTYDFAQYITEAIESVLNQTYKDFEIVVVDDGSSDETIDVLNSYGTKINWISQKHFGVSAARNTGMHLAQGTYYLGAYVKRYDFEKDLDTKFPAATITIDSDIGVSGTANLYPIFRVNPVRNSSGALFLTG